MTFTSDEDDPELATFVSRRQDQEPYKIGLSQVLPSVLINGVMGGLFFNAFVAKLEAGLTSPLDAFPLLPAVYFGVIAARSCGRLD